MNHICGYLPESITDGIGLRSVLFFSGCKHRCKGCHNPSSWNFTAGEAFDEKRQYQIIKEICSNPLIDGITLSGGDPFFSAADVSIFVDRIKEKAGMNIWIYSGFTYEEIMEDPVKKELLVKCDVLVDGKFDQSQRDVSLTFKGSRNQRVIAIQESLKSGEVILWEGF